MAESAAASAAAEPDWLLERRRDGAALATELGLPSQKTKGWEFTDLTELIEEDFEVPTESDPGARARGPGSEPAGGTRSRSSRSTRRC